MHNSNPQYERRQSEKCLKVIQTSSSCNLHHHHRRRVLVFPGEISFCFEFSRNTGRSVENVVDSNIRSRGEDDSIKS